MIPLQDDDKISFLADGKGLHIILNGEEAFRIKMSKKSAEKNAEQLNYIASQKTDDYHFQLSLIGYDGDEDASGLLKLEKNSLRPD